MTIAQRFSTILARNNVTSRRRKALLRAVAHKLDFVYFGIVDQHVDDHHIVRGFSASATHQDSSYMVGSYDGFNMTLVDRFDVEWTPKLPKKHRWLICEIQLPSSRDLPHFFLLPHHQASIHYDKLFNGMRSLEALPLEQAHQEFSSRYTLFGAATHGLELETLFTPRVLQAIAVHFWPIAVEVRDHTLYLYSAEDHLTTHHVDALIKNSTWFAQVLSGAQPQE